MHVFTRCGRLTAPLDTAAYRIFGVYLIRRCFCYIYIRGKVYCLLVLSYARRRFFFSSIEVSSTPALPVLLFAYFLRFSSCFFVLSFLLHRHCFPSDRPPAHRTHRNGGGGQNLITSSCSVFGALASRFGLPGQPRHPPAKQ